LSNLGSETWQQKELRDPQMQYRTFGGFAGEVSHNLSALRASSLNFLVLAAQSPDILTVLYLQERLYFEQSGKKWRRARLFRNALDISFVHRGK
jgi:hypothetical protein